MKARKDRLSLREALDCLESASRPHHELTSDMAVCLPIRKDGRHVRDTRLGEAQDIVDGDRITTGLYYER